MAQVVAARLVSASRGASSHAGRGAVRVAENGIDYVRAYPSAMLSGESEGLFANAADNWHLEGWLAQLGWIHALGHEGGLFVTIGRRI